MKILQTTLCIMGLAISGVAQADFIGVKGSADYWFYDGHIQVQPQSSSLSNNTGTDNLIIDPSMGLYRQNDLDRDGSVQFSLAFEHPIPLLPNAKLRYVNLNAQTESHIAGQATYDIDLDDTDFILYYEVLDNIINLDIGVGATHLNGDINNYLDQQISINKTYPILYLNAEAKLPLTGLSGLAEVTYTNIDDTKISDARAEAKYKFIDNLFIDVGAKVGYRLLKIDFDDYKNNDLKFEFKGPYVGLEAHF
ncbi:TIGR04219 family outer membrane beta-barrel protein [Acinetobacter guerrae]|uniref:TIGR04219 family outer membrane beta-barrel protein n=1 Tax=Acinetobacter guerrae TaxID=1843371 RepID=UPI00125EF28A|nr:TIGR04219 family outer membrane beta-barrel protein [Acinetobacter guerrae]